MKRAIPHGTIQIDDLVEKVVEAKYGAGAVARPTIEDGEITSFWDGEHHGQSRKYITRDGVKISQEEDTKRWESAAERIEGALLRGDITAFTKIDDKQYNPAGVRLDFLPSDWNSDTLMLALFKGEFAGPMDGGSTDVPVLVEDSLAEKWIKSVCEQETKLPVKSNNSDKPKRKSNRGRKPGRYFKLLKKFLILWDENANRSELEETETEELWKEAQSWFAQRHANIKLVGKSQLRDMIDRLKEEVIAERN